MQLAIEVAQPYVHFALESPSFYEVDAIITASAKAGVTGCCGTSSNCLQVCLGRMSRLYACVCRLANISRLLPV